MSRLYPLDIREEGTWRVEALTGHLTRRAGAQRCSPLSLLRQLHEACGLPTTGINGLVHRDGRAINSYCDYQARVTGALVRVTGVDNIIQMSLGELGAAFAANGMGAVKAYRHWCPLCYADSRRKDEEAYDMLIWQVADLEVCANHTDVLLQQCCPGCKAVQPPIPSGGAVDVCRTCGVWLGSDVKQRLPAGQADRSYQIWLTKVVPDLLEQRSSISLRLTGRDCGAFLRATLTVQHVDARELSSRICVPLDTLYQWIRGRARPTLRSWLRLCATLNVSPASALLDPIESAKQLAFPFKAAKTYVITRPKPRKRHSKVEIQAAVRHQLLLKRPTVASLPALADKVKVPISIIYFHAPDLTKRLARKFRARRLAKRRSERESLRRSVRRALARLQRRKMPLTRRAVVSVVRRQAGCSQKSAKRAYHEVMCRVRGEGGASSDV